MNEYLIEELPNAKAIVEDAFDLNIGPISVVHGPELATRYNNMLARDDDFFLDALSKNERENILKNTKKTGAARLFIRGLIASLFTPRLATIIDRKNSYVGVPYDISLGSLTFLSNPRRRGALLHEVVHVGVTRYAQRQGIHLLSKLLLNSYLNHMNEGLTVLLTQQLGKNFGDVYSINNPKYRGYAQHIRKIIGEDNTPKKNVDVFLRYVTQHKVTPISGQRASQGVHSKLSVLSHPTRGLSLFL